MADTEEKWAKFTMGAAFPADSMLARWIAGLATIANDLTQTNVALIEAFESSGASLCPEGVFGFWVTCAQYREAAKFLHAGWQNPDVVEFTGGLPREVRDDWNRIRRSFDPWGGSFVETVMKPLRDRLFHYPAPGAAEWEPVLRDLASHESGVRVRGAGELRGVRNVFADEVRVGLLSAYLGSDPAEMGNSVAEVSNLVQGLVSFAHECMMAYLAQFPDGVVRIEDGET